MSQPHFDDGLSAPHEKERTILLWKKNTEEQAPPRINKTNCTHMIWYFRDCIQYHDIHTVYIYMYIYSINFISQPIYRMYSKRSQPQQVTAVHQYLGTQTASVGSWPGTARTAFHSEKLVKIACKEVVNPHKTDHLQSPPTRFWTLPTKKKIDWYCWRFKNPAVAIAPAQIGGHYLHSFIHPRWLARFLHHLYWLRFQQFWSYGKWKRKWHPPPPKNMQLAPLGVAASLHPHSPHHLAILYGLIRLFQASAGCAEKKQDGPSSFRMIPRFLAWFLQ